MEVSHYNSKVLGNMNAEPFVHCSKLIPGIYVMKPVLKFCNAKEPANEAHLIGHVRVRQMHPRSPHQCLSHGRLCENRITGGASAYLSVLEKVRHGRARHFTQVLLSIWLSTVGKINCSHA